MTKLYSKLLTGKSPLKTEIIFFVFV